jgi:biopolymer transport protein TolQ
LILQKFGLFGRIRRESDQFLKIFRATKGVANPQGLVSAGSPFSKVYAAGYRELQSQVTGQTSNPSPQKIKSLGAVTVSMQLAATDEVRRAEKGMSWLATTAAVTPFIGLFGTVWGIMHAFQAIAIEKNTNLSVVAPAIAQALFATAIGLAAAIPAYIGYNKFSADAGKFAARLEGFADDLVTAIQRRLAERSA